MPDNETTSAAIESYLRNIIADDIDKKSGICFSSLYIELSAELSINDIMPFTPRVIENDEDRGQKYEITELVEKEENLIISGISGSGKTTILRWLNVINAKKFLEEKRDFLISSGNCFFHFIHYEVLHIVESRLNLISTK